jgi:ankyrin repeat protein
MYSFRQTHLNTKEIDDYNRLSPHERFLVCRAREPFRDIPSLPLAASLGDVETVKALISSGENPDSSANDGLTGLMHSARFGNVEIVRLLLGAGASVHSRDIRRAATPLICAAENGEEEIVNLLLDAGADRNIKTNVRMTFLHAAVAGHNLQVMKTALASEPNVDVQTDHGSAPLHFAAWSRDLNILRLLIEHGADVNLSAVDGSTALIAVTTDDNSFQLADLECTKLLVEHGADVNAQDKEGRTPLMGASFYGELAVVKFLREHGARVETTDARGRTAATHALTAGNSDIVEFLSQ